MLQSEIFPYITKDYLPNAELFSYIARAPKNECARLALVLSEADRELAIELLKDLKLSNKQVTAVCAILSCMRHPVQSPTDARHLIASCGIYAPLAVRLSILLDHSPEDAITWVEENSAPCTVSQLAISGQDLISFGISGKDIGIILQALLDAVLEDPSLNQRDRLLALAKNIFQESKDVSLN